jgi:hypothetical protein
MEREREGGWWGESGAERKKTGRVGCVETDADADVPPSAFA